MRYLIDFYNTATDAEISQYLTDNGCTVIKEWDNFEKEFLVECNSAPPKTAIVEHLADDGDVLAIKPLDVANINYNFGKSVVPGMDTQTISTTSVDDWWKNYVLENPVFDQPTTTISRKGRTIPVYIMDSGIKADHPDFAGVSITNIWSIFPGDYNDTGGHGTALASVISGRSAGITDCPLKIVKIFGNVNGTKHNTLQSEFIDACNAILNDFVPNTLAILNCSFVMARNLYIENKLRQLNDAGIFIVAAAGNNGTSIEDLTPACMPEAITIGAYNQDLVPCNFSNYTGTLSVTTDVVNHGELDGWAPGENIRVAGLDNSFFLTAGTSIATAITAAVLAYDMHDFIDPNTQQRFLGWADMPLIGGGHFNGTYSSTCLRREGLLDLSDPKYANSRNLIATIYQAVDNTDNLKVTGLTDVIKWVVKVGERRAGPVVTIPHATHSVEILSPLPDGFVIQPNSQLAGAPTVEQGPGEGEDYKLYTSKIKCNYLDGTSEEKTVDIYVAKSDFTNDSVPEDHPLYVTQAGLCFGMRNYSCGPTIATSCTNSCSSAYCCDEYYKGSPCRCI